LGSRRGAESAEDAELGVRAIDEITSDAIGIAMRLRLMKLPVRLVINFGGSALKDGVRRVVNGHVEPVLSASSASLREPDFGA
jgi:hypothetical protein